MPENEKFRCRDWAIDLLNEKKDKELTLLSSTCLGLASLFSEDAQVDQAIYWLKRNDSKRSDYKINADILFKKGLFEQGLSVLDAPSLSIDTLFSQRLVLGDQPRHDLFDRSDFIECLAYYLQT